MRELTTSVSIKQVMSVFSKQDKKAFRSWLANKDNKNSFCQLMFGHPYYVLNLTQEFEQDSLIVPTDVQTTVCLLKNIHTASQISYFINSYLIFILNQQQKSSFTLVIFSEFVLKGLLDDKYAPETFTPSEVRVLAQLLADPNIKHAAEADKVKVSTKETHYKAAANKIGGHKRAGVIANLTAQLLLEMTATTQKQNDVDRNVLNQYRQTYLPDTVSSIKLETPTGKLHRYLEMGPKSGKVFIVLHPMILPDFREEDINLLYEFNLRLIWPLRHGFLEPNQPTLSVDEQLKDTISSLKLAKKHYCDGPFILAAMITSGWFAIRYIKQFPEDVSSVIFTGACEDRQKTIAKKKPSIFGNGLVSLAVNNQKVINSTFAFIEKNFNPDNTFYTLLKKIHAYSKPDVKILEQEGNAKRFFFSLQHSVSSLKHDFLQQTNMGWHLLNDVATPKHFIHGNEDSIPTIEELKDLISTLPNTKLHILNNCAKFMYYEHFDGVLKIAAQVAEQTD